MKAEAKIRAWYAFVTAVVLCTIAAAGWGMLLAFGRGMKDWSDGAGVHAATPIADFVGAVCPFVTLSLTAAAFYPGISSRSYIRRLAAAFMFYLGFLATLLPKHGPEAGLGLAFGAIVGFACLAALKSLPRKTAQPQPQPTR